MKALILAAGYATRLYPLTKEYPKPLLPIGKKPVIDFILDKLLALRETNEVIVVTNSRFAARFSRWAASSGSRRRISLVDDLSKSPADRRGAIGDMKFAIDKKRIKDDLLVIGGDNLFDRDLEGFLSFARSKRPSVTIGAYDVKHKRLASKYGVVRLNGKNSIVDFKEKPAHPDSTFVAMCLYYFPKEKLKVIGEYINMIKRPSYASPGQARHDAMGFYIDWLSKREPVYGYVFGGSWYDIGDIDCYKKATERFSKQEVV